MNTTVFFSGDYIFGIKVLNPITGERNKNYKVQTSGKATITHQFHSIPSLTIIGLPSDEWCTQ